MLAKNRTEELVFHLMRSKKKSFHFGDISLGVIKLLDALKEKDFIVQFTVKEGVPEPQILSKAECELMGIPFEHSISMEK